MLRDTSKPGFCVEKWSGTTIKVSLQTLADGDKEALLAHLWIDAQAPFRRPVRSGFRFNFPQQVPGTAQIYLGPTASSDWIDIARFANEKAPQNSLPPLASSDHYALSPASSRYFRRWLAQHNVN